MASDPLAKPHLASVSPIAPADKPPLSGCVERKITDSMAADIAIWAAEANSPGNREIAKRLMAKYSPVTITPQAIGQHLRTQRDARRSTTQAVITESVGRFIVNDLQILKDTKAELVRLKSEFKRDKDWNNYKGMVDRIQSITKQLMDLSGANDRPNQTNEAEAAKQELIDAIEAVSRGR